MKWLGQYIQSFKARFRDDLYIENGGDFYITDSTDSGDYFKIETTTHGATTLTTVDDDAAAANFEIAADGSITLDSASSINLETIDDNYINLKNVSNTFAYFSGEAGNVSSFRMFEQGGDSSADYLQITVGEHGETTITTVDAAAAAANLTLTADGQFSIASTGIDIALNGTITNATWQGTAVASAYIADDAITFAKASGITPNVYGNVIKLLPSDFATNTDGGNTKFGMGYVDVAGTGYGMRVPNNATELYAFVSIPEGMKATHVDLYDKNDIAFEVFEIQINATTMTSKGSGECNTTLDITDVNATATNMLAIEYQTADINDRLYGGIVTIAAI